MLLSRVLPVLGLLAMTIPLSARPLAILPLGDSITQGGVRDRQEYSYRLPLQKMLREAGVAFDFIGSMNKGLHPDATWPEVDGRPFDPDHEGHYGWKTAAVRDRLKSVIDTYPAAPDVVLIHLGTNDQKHGDFPNNYVAPLRDIITLVRGKNPKVVVLLGHLNFKEGAAAEMRPLAEALAKELSTAESPVVTVAHYEGFNARPDGPDPDTFDWAHPNPAGQEKMARKWFEAMKPYLPVKGS